MFVWKDEEEEQVSTCQERCYVLYSYETELHGQTVTIERWSKPRPRNMNQEEFVTSEAEAAEVRKANKEAKACGLL